MKTGKYYYAPHNNHWHVYDENGNKIGGDIIFKEDARKEVYQLNGWKWKGK